MGQQDHRRTESPASNEAGFSYIEALLAMAVLMSVMAVAMVYFMDFGAALNTESTKLKTQQTTRIALDDLTRGVRQLGYGIRRPDVYNPGRWQRGLVYGGSHVLAFNADIDGTVGNLPSSETLTFPTGPAYTGEGIGATTLGAETYVYTLDANDDGTIDADDRVEAATNSFNPAGENANPLDFALFRRVYGFNGVDYGGELEPLSGNLFTNATTSDKFPDNSTPDPLFTYWLTEDLNGDGSLDPAECVNTALDGCPPSADRDPVLYLWGDSDFDGALSETEKTALRALEVGSASWSNNPGAASGSFKATALQSATAGDGSDYELDLADGSVVGAGYLVRIGTGSGAEVVYIESVDTTVTPHRASLVSAAQKAHAVGSAVTVTQDTFLRAVRGVELTYGAISDQPESVDGVLAAGRAGGTGSRGLDYRVSPVRRIVRLVNPTTAASPGLAAKSVEICPVVVVNACSGGDSEDLTQYLGAPPADLSFLVKDALDNAIPGVTITLSNSDTSVGTLTSTSAVSDDSGIATADYVLAGTLGDDVVTANVSCTDGDGATHSSTATKDVRVLQLTTSLDADCLSTVSDRTPAPAANFALEVTSGSGPVLNEPLLIGLELDPAYMEPSADFTDVRGSLVVDGSPAGTTDTSQGALEPAEFQTDSSGRIEGTLGLTVDDSGEGARLKLLTQVPQDGCAAPSATLEQKVDFLSLSMDSITPSGGCDEGSPCVIQAGDDAPEVEAVLTMGGTPVPNAALDFETSDDYSYSVPPDTPDPESKLSPPSVTSDADGAGTTRVSNNGSPVITPLAPLVVQVDVESAGPPSQCASGSIASSTEVAQFDFHTPMSLCKVDLLDAWVVKKGNDKICLNVMNDNSLTTGCPQIIKGVQMTVFLGDGYTPDSSVIVKEIKGGNISTFADCSNGDSVQLFKDRCKDPKALLANGEAWPFTDFEDCSKPTLEAAPGEFFVFDEIRFDDDYPPGAKLGVRLYYECTDECEGGGTESEIFYVNLP